MLYRALLCFDLMSFDSLCYDLLCFALLNFDLLSFDLLCFALLSFDVLCFVSLCYAVLCYSVLCLGVPRALQVINDLCKRSSLFQSMIEMVQPSVVIAVMSTLPMVLRWVGHLEVRGSMITSRRTRLFLVTLDREDKNSYKW